MTTAVRSRVHAHVSLWFLVYLVIGFIVAISQGYWDFTEWDGHELGSFLTALVATLVWPISIFYTFALYAR
jgi:hypothetical protein